MKYFFLFVERKKNIDILYIITKIIENNNGIIIEHYDFSFLVKDSKK